MQRVTLAAGLRARAAGTARRAGDRSALAAAGAVPTALRHEEPRGGMRNCKAGATEGARVERRGFRVEASALKPHRSTLEPSVAPASSSSSPLHAVPHHLKQFLTSQAVPAITFALGLHRRPIVFPSPARPMRFLLPHCCCRAPRPSTRRAPPANPRPPRPTRSGSTPGCRWIPPCASARCPTACATTCAATPSPSSAPNCGWSSTPGPFSRTTISAGSRTSSSTWRSTARRTSPRTTS